MFGKKTLTAEDVIKIIDELGEEEQDKLFSKLTEIEEEAKEEATEETPAEETPAETTEETPDETTEEVTEEVTEETPVEEVTEEVTEEETPEETAEVETHEEEAKDEEKEALLARISSLEELLATLTERVDNIVNDSESKPFGTPSEAPIEEGDKETMTDAERNYYAKVTRR